MDVRKLNQEKSDFDSHMHFEKERHQRMITDLKEQLQWAYDENASLKSSAATNTEASNAVETTTSSVPPQKLEKEMDAVSVRWFSLTLQRLHCYKHIS